MNKIKDAVPAGVHASDQVRPSHRTLRRNAGRKLTKRSLLHQFGKVRHLPFPNEFTQELRVHAINAEDDELVVAVPTNFASRA